jgi:hypothetical protein
MSVLRSLLMTIRDCGHSRAILPRELLALRHQLHVLERSQGRRLRLTRLDRLLWVWCSRVWSQWRSALAIVKPETVIGWHRRGFRLFWTWKSRHQTGRSAAAREVRMLIHTMSAANPLWGAPRLHGSCSSWASQSLNHRREIYGPSTWPTLADVAHLLDEPRAAADRGRRLRRPNRDVPAADCPGAPRPRPSTRGACSCDGASHGRVGPCSSFGTCSRGTDCLGMSSEIGIMRSIT